MKNNLLYLLLLLIISTSCKEQTQEKQVNMDDNSVIHITDPNGESLVYEDLIAQHKGKVVYVDFWASWCAPCKAELPYSHELKETYKDKDVVFLYISIDAKKTMWEKAIKQHHLEENSYLASNYPKAKLFQLRNVNSIPRYMLYDKEGKMVNDNVMRPSSPVLTQVLDKMLEQ